MNVLKNPSFFRPSSRPSSPAPLSVPRPDTNQPMERTVRPLTKLSSFSNFMRPSPSSSPAPQPATLVQDGSYLEMLSLKLSEAVTRALSQPTGPPTSTDLFGGKKPLPQGRGTALGTLISSELKAAHEVPHLYRAVLRSLQRPLSVLLTNLSGMLLPLLASPSFLAIPTPSNQSPFPTPVQAHALSVVNFCEELLQLFDQLGLGLDSDVRGDGLKSIRDGLVSLVSRVSNPLINAIRGEIIPLIEALENPNTSTPAKLLPGPKSAVLYHPSIVALQTLMPAYNKALTACTMSSLSHATLASLLISVLWKASVALVHRVEAKPSPAQTPNSSPLLTAKKRRGSPTTTTPPVTPPPARFTIKLPPSRPPSPPALVTYATTAADAKALYELLVGLPRPSSGQPSTKLAREAVDEALEGFKNMAELLASVRNRTESMDPIAIAKELNRVTEEIPSLIALPVILHAFGGPGASSVAPILGISEDEYRKGCLSGFSRAEECALAICQRALDVLQTDPFPNQAVIHWLEMELAEMQEYGP
ncbi:hypothetical protein CPB83DRAFT_315100 [Crepidotus variabilis]|uniref:Uncharacterized protein n=1 Tax=Crepidotus variabilis TaxID=179855 RepID=A0A9P6EGY9_9AGAR|nr:hypothetical protein CPB83DRAFT_315100 [Crepidotus variabilis]